MPLNMESIVEIDSYIEELNKEPNEDNQDDVQATKRKLLSKFT